MFTKLYAAHEHFAAPHILISYTTLMCPFPLQKEYYGGRMMLILSLAVLDRTELN